jgi:tRNA (guanine26-N2/guanine27-N2)-dimethyltransferase
MAENTTIQQFTTVTEGKATILFPKDQVFYNPAQQFNRDLSVAVIRTWSESLAATKSQLRKAAWDQKKKRRKEVTPESPSVQDTSSTEESAPKNGADPPTKKITILEALSATGLRAIRYALEIPNVSTVLANDMSPDAITAIHRNISHNTLPPGLVTATCSDANTLMYSRHSNRVDVVDLDPYGTAAPFIDAAIQAIAGDGLLCVTCTDMSVLAGIGYPEKCYANYGGSPVKQEYTHEVALRLVLNSIASTAAKYGRAIVPLLSLSIDFYVRLFIKVVQSPAQVKFLARYGSSDRREADDSKTMITYACEGCGSWSNQFMGRIGEKGGSIRFQLNPGPPADGNCVHCGSRQFVRLDL